MSSAAQQTNRMTTHAFKPSRPVGSDRCQICGEVRTNLVHPVRASEDADLSRKMFDALPRHTMTYEQIMQIKGVAFIMLCEEIAKAQPEFTTDQIMRLWLAKAIEDLKNEGSL